MASQGASLQNYNNELVKCAFLVAQLRAPYVRAYSRALACASLCPPCDICRKACAALRHLFLAEALLDCVCRNLARWMLFVVQLYQDRGQRDLQQASAAGHSTCLSGAARVHSSKFLSELLRTGHVRVGTVTVQIPQINHIFNSDFTPIFLALILKVAPPCTVLWVGMYWIACLN